MLLSLTVKLDPDEPTICIPKQFRSFFCKTKQWFSEILI